MFGVLTSDTSLGTAGIVCPISPPGGTYTLLLRGAVLLATDDPINVTLSGGGTGALASGSAVALGYGPTPFVQDVALSTTLTFDPPLGVGASWLIELHGELTVVAGGSLSATLSVSGSSGICRAGSYLELIGQ